MNDTNLSLIIREASDNGKEALRILWAHYASKVKARIISLYTELTSLKKDCNGSVTDNKHKNRNNFNITKKSRRNIKWWFKYCYNFERFTENPFSVYVIHSSKELPLLEFKTHLLSFDTPQNIVNSSDDNVMKLTTFPKLNELTVNENHVRQEALCFTCDGKDTQQVYVEILRENIDIGATAVRVQAIRDCCRYKRRDTIKSITDKENSSFSFEINDTHKRP